MVTCSGSGTSDDSDGGTCMGRGGQISVGRDISPRQRFGKLTSSSGKIDSASVSLVTSDAKSSEVIGIRAALRRSSMVPPDGNMRAALRAAAARSRGGAPGQRGPVTFVRATWSACGRGRAATACQKCLCSEGREIVICGTQSIMTWIKPRGGSTHMGGLIRWVS